MDAFSSGVTPVDRLSSLFNDVKIDDVTAHEGLLKLFEELKECYEAQEPAAPTEYMGEQDEELKQICTQASLLFVARVMFAAQSRDCKIMPANLGCPISRIVAAAGINLLDFFREVNVVVSKLSTFFESRGGSARLFTQQAQLKENSETVVVMGLLAKKYKDNFHIFLHQLELYKQMVLKLGWSAFLVLRVKLLSAFPDVVSCMELLPCVFAVLACHAPRLPDCLSHLSHEDGRPALLKTMSEMCKADYSRVQARMPSVVSLLSHILTTAVPEWRAAISGAKMQMRQTGTTVATNIPFIGPLDLMSSPVLEGLVTDADRMQRAITALEAEYERHYKHGGSELDEREFLFTDFTKFASPRFSPRHMHSAITKLQSGPTPLRQGALLGPGAHITASSVSPHLINFTMPIPAGTHSPLPMLNLAMDVGQPTTPVSEVMSASAWLRALTANLATEPSPGLMRYLAAIDMPLSGTRSTYTSGYASAAEQLGQRVRDLVSSVMPEEEIPSLLGPFPLLQSSLAVERRTEITKLYYHSLEIILQNEEKASGLAGVAPLLASGKFHRALVTCCIEVVAACYRMVSCAFPKVLDALHIKAIDLPNMIQSFVKSIETLPRELKRHLFLIEEKILESLAWEPGSSLYSHITSITNDGMVMDQTAANEVAASHAVSEGGVVMSVGSSPASACIPVDGGGPDVLKETGGTIFMGVTHYSKKNVSTSLGRPPSSFPMSSVAVGHQLSPKRHHGSAALELMSPAKKARGVQGSPQPVIAIAGRLPKFIGQKVWGVAGTGGSAGALRDFCRKVLKLAAFRLALMCDNFDFTPLNRAEVNAKVYETIEHALYYQTHLFYNRHIDQIILSALYGYCKVHKLTQVSFREIIAHYRKQPQAQQCIFRSVIIEQSNPDLQVAARADIIAFYNQVFVPSMKSFLLKGEQNCAVTSGDGVDKMAGDGNSIKTGPAACTAAGGSQEALQSLSFHSTSRLPKLASLPATASPVRGLSRQAPKGDTVADASQDLELCSVVSAGSFLVVTDAAGPQCSPVLSHSATCGLQSGSSSGKQTKSTMVEIPDGLAALLQALDSQQGLQGNRVEDHQCSEVRLHGGTGRIIGGDDTNVRDLGGVKVKKQPVDKRCQR
uniref:Retinoblastoma-like protein n=1 Tax=Volvox africanus TaxID=51714 RepID=N0DW46_9CHLO|nr:retinoblastoma-like protein [Volvox africanus]